MEENAQPAPENGATVLDMNEANSESAKDLHLTHPWFVAVWPGMGNVAVSAGYYLMAKLEMHQLAELPAREFFDLHHIEVKGGLLSAGRRPRSRLFVWKDPRKNHDIIVFIGEAQPPTGKYLFCQKLIDFAKELGVEKVLTFAAMATDMHPTDEARVFGIATDKKTLAELENLELEILESGQISGLNGVLLGVAAESGLPGACLLGEIPHIFSQLPFPKASLAVLEAFTAMTRIDLDVTELFAQARSMEQQLGSLLDQIEMAIKMQQAELEENPELPGPSPEPGEATVSENDKSGISSQDRLRIGELFTMAANNRSKAFELKAELDRLKIFGEYEDRFLDLFQKPR